MSGNDKNHNEDDWDTDSDPEDSPEESVSRKQMEAVMAGLGSASGTGSDDEADPINEKDAFKVKIDSKYDEFAHNYLLKQEITKESLRNIVITILKKDQSKFKSEFIDAHKKSGDAVISEYETKLEERFTGASEQELLGTLNDAVAVEEEKHAKLAADEERMRQAAAERKQGEEEKLKRTIDQLSKQAIESGAPADEDGIDYKELKKRVLETKNKGVSDPKVELAMQLAARRGAVAALELSDKKALLEDFIQQKKANTKIDVSKFGNLSSMLTAKAGQGPRDSSGSTNKNISQPVRAVKEEEKIELELPKDYLSSKEGIKEAVGILKAYYTEKMAVTDDPALRSSILMKLGRCKKIEKSIEASDLSKLVGEMSAVDPTLTQPVAAKALPTNTDGATLSPPLMSNGIPVPPPPPPSASAPPLPPYDKSAASGTRSAPQAPSSNEMPLPPPPVPQAGPPARAYVDRLRGKFSGESEEVKAALKAMLEPILDDENSLIALDTKDKAAVLKMLNSHVQKNRQSEESTREEQIAQRKEDVIPTILTDVPPRLVSEKSMAKLEKILQKTNNLGKEWTAKELSGFLSDVVDIANGGMMSSSLLDEGAKEFYKKQIKELKKNTDFTQAREKINVLAGFLVKRMGLYLDMHNEKEDVLKDMEAKVPYKKLVTDKIEINRNLITALKGPFGKDDIESMEGLSSIQAEYMLDKEIFQEQLAAVKQGRDAIQAFIEGAKLGEKTARTDEDKKYFEELTQFETAFRDEIDALPLQKSTGAASEKVDAIFKHAQAEFKIRMEVSQGKEKAHKMIEGYITDFEEKQKLPGINATDKAFYKSMAKQLVDFQEKLIKCPTEKQGQVAQLSQDAAAKYKDAVELDAYKKQAVEACKMMIGELPASETSVADKQYLHKMHEDLSAKLVTLEKISPELKDDFDKIEKIIEEIRDTRAGAQDALSAKMEILSKMDGQIKFLEDSVADLYETAAPVLEQKSTPEMLKIAKALVSQAEERCRSARLMRDKVHNELSPNDIKGIETESKKIDDLVGGTEKFIVIRKATLEQTRDLFSKLPPPKKTFGFFKKMLQCHKDARLMVKNVEDGKIGAALLDVGVLLKSDELKETANNNKQKSKKPG